MSSIVNRLSLLVGTLSAALALVCAAGIRAETLQHGAFTIDNDSRRVGLSGLFSPTGRSTRSDVDEYRVSYRGKVAHFRNRRLTLDASRDADSRFHDVRLIASTVPALIVLHGGIHLLTDRDGTFSAEPLTGQVTGVEFFQWLDSSDGQPGPRMVSALRKKPEGESLRLEGGRYLLLGNRVVLDTRTLETFPYPGRIAEDTEPLGGYYLMQTDSPFALSPTATTYVVKLAGNPQSSLPDALVTIDFRRGQHRIIALDRSRTPFVDLDKIDRAWLLRHFVWVTESGTEVLRRRR